MNPKPLFISNLVVTLLAAMALEGNALSLGQAVTVLVPAGVLRLGSFMQTDWWEGGEKDVDKRVYREHESGDCCHQADKKSA